MFPDIAVFAVVLIVGNILFHHFDPQMPLWRRILKILVILAVASGVSFFFGRTGLLIASGLALAPVIYIHAFWLPRHGVNGWTGQPRAKYHALRGWPPL